MSTIVLNSISTLIHKTPLHRKVQRGDDTFQPWSLLTQSECLHDSTIAVDVVLVEVLEHLTATTYELRQRACCTLVLVVGILAVLCENLLLFSLI